MQVGKREHLARRAAFVIRASPGFVQRLRERESSLLTAFWTDPLNHRNDFSRPALRHGSLNSLFPGSLISTFLVRDTMRQSTTLETPCVSAPHTAPSVATRGRQCYARWNTLLEGRQPWRNTGWSSEPVLPLPGDFARHSKSKHHTRLRALRARASRLRALRAKASRTPYVRAPHLRHHAAEHHSRDTVRQRTTHYTVCFSSRIERLHVTPCVKALHRASYVYLSPTSSHEPLVPPS